MTKRQNSPKDEVWMRHEIRYALKHTPRLEDEGREGDFGEVHADSGGVRPHRGGQGISSAVVSRASVVDGDAPKL